MPKNRQKKTKKTINGTGKAREKAADNHMVLYVNSDKVEPYQLGPQEWMPHNTSRVLLSGVPGSGKTNVIRNIIERADPPFTSIHLVHLDPTGQTEYNWLYGCCKNVYVYGPDQFPGLSNIDHPDGTNEDDAEDEESDELERDPKSVRPCLICDEVTWDVLSKDARTRFDRMLGYVCTHRSMPMFVSVQNLMSIGPKARRLFNFFCLWAGPDQTAHKVAASKCGIDLKLMEGLFSLCRSRYDFIAADCDRPVDCPWRYRLSLVEPIIIEDASHPTSGC